MCLRPDTSTGDPVSSDKNLGTVRKKLHGFVYALLTFARIALETIESESEKD